MMWAKYRKRIYVERYYIQKKKNIGNNDKKKIRLKNF